MPNTYDFISMVVIWCTFQKETLWKYWESKILRTSKHRFPLCKIRVPGGTVPNVGPYIDLVLESFGLIYRPRELVGEVPPWWKINSSHFQRLTSDFNSKFDGIANTKIELLGVRYRVRWKSWSIIIILEGYDTISISLCYVI